MAPPLTDLEGPAQYPPEGVQPNFSGHSDGEIYYYTLLPVFTILSGIFVILRMYTKARVVRKFNISDYLLLVSFTIFIAIVILGRFTVSNGAGTHQWNVQLKYYIKMGYYMNTAESIWCPCIFLLKTAIVLQYVEMLAPNRTVNAVMWWGSWIIIGAMFTFYTCDFFLTLFICNPRTKIWNDLEDGKCLNYNALVVASALFNIASDLAILLLPVRSVWKLRIAPKRKVAIILLFCTGLFACAASSMRIYYIALLGQQGDRPDNSYYIAWMGVWSYAEIALGTMIACGLTLPRLFQHHGIHLSSFISSLSKPFSSLKLSFIGISGQGSENEKKNSSEFKLTFNQGKAFGDKFTESRIVPDRMSRMLDSRVLESRVEPERDGASEMDLEFGTGNYLLDGRSGGGSEVARSFSVPSSDGDAKKAPSTSISEM